MAVVLQAPGPRSLLPGRHLFTLLRQPIPFLMALAQRGDITSVSLGLRRLFFLNHPDLVQELLVTQAGSFEKGIVLQRSKRLLGEGLLTSEGALHLRQRRLVQPAFHRQQIARYGAIMAAQAARLCESWEDGACLDIAEEMRRLTLAIVGRTLFGADVEGCAADVGDALNAFMDLSNSLLLPFAPLLEKLPLPLTRRIEGARARLDAIIDRFIADRLQTGDQGDLLSMLLLSRHEDDGGPMTDAHVRDEAMTLFLAGHETTANALAWTWFLLAEHPDVAERLEAEVDSLPGNRLPGAEDLPRLDTTRRVLAEAMRLYPPAWAIGRRALRDVELGGYHVPSGSIVAVSQYVMHRDPRFFPNPLVFDPERWTPEAQASRPRFAYFPFGAGNRICIGESFAWMEGILILAVIARRWRMHRIPNHPVEPLPRITLRPKHGVKVRLERRPLPHVDRSC